MCHSLVGSTSSICSSVSLHRQQPHDCPACHGTGTHVVEQEQGRDEFENLHHAHMLAETSAIAATKGEVGLVHARHATLKLGRRVVGRLQPPVRIEGLGVLPEDVLVLVDHPRVHAHDGPRGQDASVGEGESSGGDDAFEREPHGRMHAHAFENDGDQIRNVLRRFEGDWKGQLGGVQLVLELAMDTWVLQHIVYDGPEGDGGGVRAGKQLVETSSETQADGRRDLYLR